MKKIFSLKMNYMNVTVTLLNVLSLGNHKNSSIFSEKETIFVFILYKGYHNSILSNWIKYKTNNNKNIYTHLVY